MIKAAKINGTGERKVQKYLTAQLGNGFCPTPRSIDRLSDGHVEVQCKSIYFTFDGKQEKEFVKWTEKDMANAISWNLSRQLECQKINSSDVLRIGVVAGSDHGNVAFQFGASVHVKISDGSRMNFKVSVIELICRKDSAKLIQATILPGLTSSLKKVATLRLHIHKNDSKIHCKFGKTSTIIPPQQITKMKGLIVVSPAIWPSKPCPWAGNPWPDIGACSVLQRDRSSLANIHHG